LRLSRHIVQAQQQEGVLALEALNDAEGTMAPICDTWQGPRRVAVVGLGYVGLPTALAFFAAGFRVLGLDTNPHRLSAIRMGQADLLPADRARLRLASNNSSFYLSHNPHDLASAEAVIICVPTPVDTYSVPDLSALRSACEATVNAARPGQTIVLTSTSYVGTTRDFLIRPLTERGLRIGEDLYVVFSPERIDPGNSTIPQEHLPRVIGGATPRCTTQAERLFACVTSSVHVVSSPETAEMTKLHENVFRAVNIALANEMSDVSQALGLDVMEVIDAASTKPYGFMPFYPGPGVGGHCIPCDPYYLLWQLRPSQAIAPLVRRAMERIAGRPFRVVTRVTETLDRVGRCPSGARILVVGVAYKPSVADVRESPALVIISELLNRGAEVAYYDPLVPQLELPDGSEMLAICDPATEQFDLVVTLILHPRVDYGWIANMGLVVDATYRLPKLSQSVLV
jgi:UDP-N-acetyl-D-glucosamine dehydrogenase